MKQIYKDICIAFISAAFSAVILILIGFFVGLGLKAGMS
jgi:hypothetical protein